MSVEMTPRFRTYELGRIRVGGMIRERMERAAHKILHHIRMEEDFLRHFQARKVTPETFGGFVGAGMLLDAMVKAAAQNFGGAALYARKKAFAEALIRTQSADGSISIFAGTPGVWDNHEQAYIIQALVHDFRFFGEKESLAAASRLGQFLIARKTGANIGVEQAMLMLYESTGDLRFLDYCRKELKITGAIEEVDDHGMFNGFNHVYSYLARALAQVKYAQLTGDDTPQVWACIHEAYRRLLHGGYAAVTGGCTGGLIWGELWDNARLGLGLEAETCAAAYLLRDSIQMLAVEGDPVYGDVFERVMYNTFFAAQSADGCAQKYFVPFNESGKWFDRDTFCCPNNFLRMVFELPQAVFFRAPDGIAVNLYNPAELEDDLASLRLTGGYPETDSAELEITPKTDRPFALYFRIPRWCGNAEVIAGNERFSGNAGTFLAVRRVWKPGKITIHLPMRIRFVAGKAAQTGKAAVLRGPVVYGWKNVPEIVPALARFLLDPAPRYENGRIFADVTWRNAGFRHKTMELVPFCSPDREITFFRAPERTEEDELFQQDESL